MLHFPAFRGIRLLEPSLPTPNCDGINVEGISESLLSQSYSAPGMADLASQVLRHGFRIIPKETNDRRNLATAWDPGASFPVLQGLDVDPEFGRNLLLEHVEGYPTPPDVLSERPGGFWSLLGGDPVVWIGATQDFDVQVAKGQRIPLRRSTLTTLKTDCCATTMFGWRSWHRTNRRHNTSTTEQEKTTRTRT